MWDCASASSTCSVWHLRSSHDRKQLLSVVIGKNLSQTLLHSQPPTSPFFSRDEDINRRAHNAASEVLFLWSQFRDMRLPSCQVYHSVWQVREPLIFQILHLDGVHIILLVILQTSVMQQLCTMESVRSGWMITPTKHSQNIALVYL